MSNRTVRVNELVQRELSAILHQHYQSETVAVTISEVRVSPDLRDARVFVSVIGDDDMATAKLRWLRSRAVDIRQELGRRIVLKFLPKFEYVLDRTAIRSSRITQVLDKLKPAEPAEGTENDKPSGDS
jgi:ribosome-binding factor A